MVKSRFSIAERDKTEELEKIDKQSWNPFYSDCLSRIIPAMNLIIIIIIIIIIIMSFLVLHRNLTLRIFLYKHRQSKKARKLVENISIVQLQLSA